MYTQLELREAWAEFLSGYAFQWFALCAAAIILWIVTGVARAREDST